MNNRISVYLYGRDNEIDFGSAHKTPGIYGRVKKLVITNAKYDQIENDIQSERRITTGTMLDANMIQRKGLSVFSNLQTFEATNSDLRFLLRHVETENLERLTSISLNKVTVTAKGLKDIIKASPDLTTMDISGCTITGHNNDVRALENILRSSALRVTVTNTPRLTNRDPTPSNDDHSVDSSFSSLTTRESSSNPGKPATPHSTTVFRAEMQKAHSKHINQLRTRIATVVGQHNLACRRSSSKRILYQETITGAQICSTSDRKLLLTAEPNTVFISPELEKQMNVTEQARLILSALGFPSLDPQFEHPEQLYFTENTPEALQKEINKQYHTIKTDHFRTQNDDDGGLVVSRTRIP